MDNQEKVTFDEVRTRVMELWADPKKRTIALAALVIGLVLILQPIIFSSEPQQRVVKKADKLTSTFFSNEGVEEIKAVQANDAFKMVQGEIRDREAELASQQAQFNREREKILNEMNTYKLEMNQLKRDFETLRKGNNGIDRGVTGSQNNGQVNGAQASTGNGTVMTHSNQEALQRNPPAFIAPSKPRAFLPPAQGSSVRTVASDVERRIDVQGNLQEVEIKTDAQIAKEEALKHLRQAEQQET